MSYNSEQASLADVFEDVVTAFEAPDTTRMHGAAVRRGRQIRRRRTGTAVAGSTVALGTAGVLAFALTAAPGHGTAAVSTAAAPTKGSAAPTFARPTSAPAIRAGAISGPVIQGALEYALPSGAVVIQTGGPTDPNVDVEAVDPSSHSWYVQTSVTIKSSGRLGTLIALSVTHTAGHDTCSALDQARAGGKGECTQSTVDGGKLLDDIVPLGVVDTSAAFEYVEWFSPTGYETDLELQDGTVGDIALTNAQTDAILTAQVFGAVARAMPADACVGGSFSSPVDSPTPGSSPLQHMRCSLNGDLYPSY